MADLRLQIFLGAIDKATGPLKRILNSSQKTAQGLARLKRQAGDVDKFRQLSAASRQLGSQLMEARQHVNGLAQTMRTTQAPSKALRNEFKTAVQTARSLGQKYDSQRERLHRLRQALNAAGIQTGQLGTHEKRLRSEITQTTATLERQRQATERLSAAQQRMQQLHRAGGMIASHGAGAMYLGMRGMRAGANAIMPGLDFDSTMSHVQALARLDKDSAAMQALRADARAKGASTLFSSTEVGQGQAFLAMAGFKPEAILASTQAMLDVALAGNLDLSRAADITSNISSAFGIDSNDAEAMNQLADQLVTGFTTANLTLEDLGETMKYFAPIAKAGNIDTATSIAMAGMFGNVGIQGSMAGTSLREMTSRMAALPKPARERLAELNVKTMDEDGNLRNIVEIIAEIDTAFKDKEYGSGQRLAALNDIFGKRAMSGMADLSEKMGSGEFQQYAEIVKNSEDNARKVAAIMADNLKGDLDQLLSAARDVSIGLFDTMAPTLRALSQSVTQLVRKLGNLIKEHPRLAKVVGLAAAGFATLLTAIGGVLLALGMLMMPLAGVQYGLTVIAAKVGPLVGSVGKLGSLFSGLGNAARMLLPVLGGISLPVLAIGAAVAAVAVLVWKYWGPIQAFMVGVWQGLEEAMSPVMDAFRDALAPLLPLWDLLASGIAAVWGWVKQLFTPFQATSEQLQGATEAGRTFGHILGQVLKWVLMPLRLVATAVGWVAGMVVSHWETIKQVFAWSPIGLIITHWEPIKACLASLLDGVLAGISRAWDVVVGIFKGHWDIIVGIFTGDGGRIMEGLGGIWDSINTLLGGWPAKMLTFGVQMLQGLITGIKSMAGAVGDAITGAVSGAVDRFKHFLGIRSPSRLFAGLGDFTMQGYAGGIVRTQREPVQAVMDMGQKLRRAAAGIALGTATAATPVMAGHARPDAAPNSSAPMHVNITINAPGGNAPDIAREVRRALEQIEHDRRARTRAWQHDYD